MKNDQNYLAQSAEPASASGGLSSAAPTVELEGILLARDRRRDRLLIAFTDMDLNTPCWLPASAVRFEFYEHAPLGWGSVEMPIALAAQRAKLTARVLAVEELAAKPRREPQPGIRRPKVFMPKTAHAASVPIVARRHQLRLPDTDLFQWADAQ